MARKPAATEPHDIEEVPPEMDYEQHNATYPGFVELTKWAIVTAVVTLVALYCFMEAHQPVLGTLLLLAIPVGAVVLVVTRSRVAS